MTHRPAPSEEVRASEFVAALCLATDLGMGFPLGHGLHSTLVAMRVAEHLGVDSETARETYYGSLLFYVGCTADAEIAADVFPEGALLEHFTPVAFGSPLETLRGIVRALANPGAPAPLRLAQGAVRLPKAGRGHKQHIDAMCQVAQMLSQRLGVPEGVTRLVAAMTERWDGKGLPNGISGEELPLALRIAHVARDATFQGMVHEAATAAEVIRRRGGGAFDPDLASLCADEYDALVGEPPASGWAEVLGREPLPYLMLRGEQIDSALSAMADFTDLVSPYLAGHSSGVADLARRAAQVCGLSVEQVRAVHRAGQVHDVGRVAVAARVWSQAGPLSDADWEQVRLHPYYSERVMAHSPFLARLAGISSHHHERLDGSGYHRGVTSAGLSSEQRLLAAADAFHAKTESRGYRKALAPEAAAAWMQEGVRAGRLDPEAVHAVVEAAGLRPPPVPYPAGLTAREAQVVGMLARGLQTKAGRAGAGHLREDGRPTRPERLRQDRRSTRAAAAVFAMQHGLLAWGELPMVGDGPGS